MSDSDDQTFLGSAPVNITVDSSPNTHIHLHVHLRDKEFDHEWIQSELRELLQWASRSDKLKAVLAGISMSM